VYRDAEVIQVYRCTGVVQKYWNSKGYKSILVVQGYKCSKVVQRHSAVQSYR